MNQKNESKIHSAKRIWDERKGLILGTTTVVLLAGVVVQNRVILFHREFLEQQGMWDQFVKFVDAY